MKVKLTDFIVNRLAEEGVTTIFGYQGGNISHFIDSIGKSDKIEFVETYHEQGAAFAANAYAQINGTIGVAIASSGPGAINLLNGVANAFCDSVPCIFFTGDVNTTVKKTNGSLRQNSFQEIDIVPIAKPICKYCVSINSPEDIIPELNKAIRIANEDRKGPVLINLPHDMQRSIIDEADLDFPESPDSNTRTEVLPAEFDLAIDRLKDAKRPVILVGGGMKPQESRSKLQKFLINHPMPVVSSLLGLDVISHDNPCYRGMIGDYGNRYANLCLKYSDCLLVLGSRLDDRQISPRAVIEFKDKTIIHVETDYHEIRNKIPDEIGVQVDVISFLRALAQSSSDVQNTNNWLNATKELMDYCQSIETTEDKVHPNELLQELSSTTDGVYTFDVGNNQMHAGQSVFIRKNSHMLASGGLGSMGYSLPAAIGACYAGKTEKTFCICGDGGLQMNIQELNTVDLHYLPINIILLNNNALGMIYDLQTKMFPGRFIGTKVGYQAPDFQKIADAYHFKYFKVQTKTDYKSALELLRTSTQVFIEIAMEVGTPTIPGMGQGIFGQSPALTNDEEVYIKRRIFKNVD